MADETTPMTETPLPKVDLPPPETSPPDAFSLLTSPSTRILPHEKADPTDDLPEPEQLWDTDFKQSLPLPVLGVLVADEIFGDKMDNEDESMFLSEMLDETQPLQGELMAKLSAMFDANGFYPPDRFSLQVFRRKGGFQSKRDDPDFGRYSAAVCLREFQVITFNREENILSNGDVSRFYELVPHPEGKKGPPAPRPGVPRNRTTIKLPNGKALLKARKYLCVLVWAFWDDDPIKPEETERKIGVESLRNLAQELRAKGETQQADDLEKVADQIGNPPSEPVTIYDSKNPPAEWGEKNGGWRLGLEKKEELEQVESGRGEEK